MITTVRLSDEITSQLNRIAIKTGRTKSFYLRKLIEEGIEKLAYEYEILQEVEDYKTGKTKTYTLEEMKKRYELDD